MPADRLGTVSSHPQLFAESLQIKSSSRLFGEHLDRKVVNPCGSLVRCDLRECSVQSSFGCGKVAENFVQAAPVEVGIERLGLKLQGPTITVRGLLVASLLLQGPAQVIVPLNTGGISQAVSQGLPIYADHTTFPFCPDSPSMIVVTQKC